MNLDDRLDNVWDDAKNDPLEEAYGFTMEEVKQAILSDLLEIIGEDADTTWRGLKIEEPETPNDLVTNVMGVVSEKFWLDGQNSLRQELRNKVKEYCK